MSGTDVRENEAMKNKQKEKKEKKPGKKIKIKKRFVALGIVIVLAAVFVYGNVTAKNTPPVVQTVTASVGTVEETLSTSGTVESEQSKTFYAPAAAKIAQVAVKAGEEVKEGEVVVSFDITDLENEKKKADLQVAQASNSYQSALTQSNDNQSDYSEATIGLDELKAMAETQETYVQGLKYQLEDDTTAEKKSTKDWIAKLQEELSIQQRKQSEEVARDGKANDYTLDVIDSLNRQITEAQNKLELLGNEGELSEKQRQIDAEQKKLDDMKEEIQKRESKQTSSEGGILDEYAKQEKAVSVETAKISAQEAANNLQAAGEGVKAEFTGIVTSMTAQEGASVTEGAELFKLESSEDVQVCIEVSKNDLDSLKEGQKADVTVAGKTYEGTVNRIDRAATKNSTGNPVVKTYIHIENPDESIYLGVDAKVLVHTAQAENVVIIPYAAVNTDKQGDFCFVVKNGVVAKQPVTTGVSSDENVEIKEGLAEGDQIVLDGSTVTEGMQVTPVTAQ